MTRLLPSLLPLCLLACKPDDTGSPDSADQTVWAGEDLDEAVERELAAAWSVPTAFYDALASMGIAPEDLTYPDAGATYAIIETRHHWTDALRHQGDLAPVFAHMVAEDVTAALAAEDPATVLRELLVAQHVYNERAQYLESRYDQRFELDPSDEQPLLGAVQAYYEHAPVQGCPWAPTEPWEDIEGAVTEQVGTIPFEAQQALALAIPALLRAAEMRDEALMGSGLVDADTWADLHEDFYCDTIMVCDVDFSTYKHKFGTDAFPAVDWQTLAHAGQLALRATESLRLALLEIPPQEGAEIELLGPLGRLHIDLSEGGELHSAEDLFLLVDRGGSDTYQDHVGVNTSFHQPLTVVLDLAGDDVWQPSSGWTIDDANIPARDTRMQGAGLFGIAIVLDAAGNDSYHSSGVAQGAGIFGVGVLADLGGDDIYRGYDKAQGHAQFGYGLLVDLGAGADRYEMLQMGQGYGGPKGMGWLVDDGGDDSYLAVSEPIIWDWAGEGTNWTGGQGFGYGVRDGFFYEGYPVYSGGLGALLDLGGDDSFECAVMCQGFGYAFGTGLFYDASGDDTHLVTHKYAMGAATHWAVGLLVDGQGSDSYRNSGDDECIGLGYDASVAWHLDLGDEPDSYQLDNAGDFAIGASRIPALGVLINEGGDDSYTIPGSGTRSLGRSYTEGGNRDGYLASVTSLGMFLDLGGSADVYDIARDDVGNGVSWTQGEDEAQGGDWTPEYDFGWGFDAE